VYAANPNNIDLVKPQWYSQPGQTDSWFINNYIIPDVISMINNGIPASKIVMLCSDSQFDGGPPSQWTTYANAYNQLINSNGITIRGFDVWQSDQDQSDGWQFETTFATTLGL
jgi:hypothetical protein